MSMKIQTFSNAKGGDSFFKALGHPLAAEKAKLLMGRLAQGRVAIYDPLGMASGFAEFYPLVGLDICGVYAQRIEDIGTTLFGQHVWPVTEIANCAASTIFVIAFDAKRLIDHIRHLVPHAEILSLDELRLPKDMLTNTRRYLDPLNFATNFGFFREADTWHTRIVTADYWSGWGAAQPPSVWCCLFDQAGLVLAQWTETLAARGASLVIDSQDIRRRFDLPEFTGSLFIHVIGVAGHDVVKYALDVYGDDEATQISCTHDANAWPSDLYAGLPAPQEHERVLLWIQNSHPVTIPNHGIGLNLMGSNEIAWLAAEIGPFATYALDIADLLPGARWPQQIEIQAGRYFVRPRYEVIDQHGRSRIAHANVERNDLTADPEIRNLAPLLGKSFILSAPILPVDQWRSVALPTAMSTAQHNLPLCAIVYDASGIEIARRSLGCIPRSASNEIDLGAWLAENRLTLPSGYGHVELIYDFSQGGDADGWLHGLFRYSNKQSGHSAETSFGAHIYNTVLTYKNEPQSYAGAPPGLSTRLFLRLGRAPLDTFCHLIYAASTPWHAQSSTTLSLYNKLGQEIATCSVNIPCSGSLLWKYSELFDEQTRASAGDDAYILIRDTTCRLFGYHGTLSSHQSFSLDHMFGF